MGIEVLLYVSVGLFSLVFSIMWEKFNLFNVAKKNHKLQYWTVFIVLYLSTCVVVYYFNMKAQKRNAELIEQKVELSQFELKTQKKADIIIKKESVENKVVNTLQQYLKADHEKNIKRIDTFFTFPMEKYYMFMNPSKEKVNNRIRFYWRHRQSDYEFPISSQNTTVSSDKSGFKVFVKMKEVGDSVIFLNVKLNTDFKIYYIGNSVLTNGDQEGY